MQLIVKIAQIVILTLVSSYNAVAETVPPIEITQVAEQVYRHVSYQEVAGFGVVSSNGLVVIDNQEAFIIDTPWSAKDTEALLLWLQARKLILIGSLSTHSHEDRTAGIATLNQRGIPTYATQQTNELLSKQNRAQAMVTINSPIAQLFKGNIDVYYPGGGHAVDNIVVWLPKSQLLFGGCLVRSADAQSLGYTGEAVLAQWPKSIEKVLIKYPTIKQLIPGHGAIGGRELLSHTLSLLTR